MRSVLVNVATLTALILLVGCTSFDGSEGQRTLTATQTPTVGGMTAAPPGVRTPMATPTGVSTRTETGDGETTEDIVVVVDADGRVVVLDAGTGDEVRDLLDGVRVDDPASNDIAVSPDRTGVFVAIPPDDPEGDSEIVRVPVDGGEPETIAVGTAPAVSPDGDTLAFVTYEQRTDGPGHPDPVVVLHDLASGQESRLAAGQHFQFVPDVEWTADGAALVFTAGEIHTGLYAVDPDAGSLEASRRLGPDLGQAGTMSWGPVAALADNQLAVVETCCGVPPEERWHITAVDVSEGATDDRLLPGGRIEATHLDSDPDAERLLIVVGGGPGGGELVRWDGTGDPEPITEGVIVAAW